MATLSDAAPAGALPLSTASPRKPRSTGFGRWGRFIVFVIVTAIVLVPVLGVIYLSLRPGTKSDNGSALTLDNFTYVLQNTDTLQWLLNSLAVTVATVVVSVAVGAPAGYVLSRGRGRAIGGYSLTLFVVQALPVITAVIPLFILFAKLGLVDNLVGLGIIYVGASMSVATWMMAAYIDSIPVDLEKAAWIDGCSVFGGFTKIVLRNSLPGILSTAIFTFLVSWNDYLVAIVFLRSQDQFTMPIGLTSFFQQNVTDWGSVMAVAVVMLAPPLILFSVMNKFFSIGGIGGSLAGQ
jgi:multiple sugar transport system permease protein